MINKTNKFSFLRQFDKILEYLTRLYVHSLQNWEKQWLLILLMWGILCGVVFIPGTTILINYSLMRAIYVHAVSSFYEWIKRS